MIYTLILVTLIVVTVFGLTWFALIARCNLLNDLLYSELDGRRNRSVDRAGGAVDQHLESTQL